MRLLKVATEREYYAHATHGVAALECGNGQAGVCYARVPPDIPNYPKTYIRVSHPLTNTRVTLISDHTVAGMDRYGRIRWELHLFTSKTLDYTKEGIKGVEGKVQRRSTIC